MGGSESPATERQSSWSGLVLTDYLMRNQFSPGISLTNLFPNQGFGHRSNIFLSLERSLQQQTMDATLFLDLSLQSQLVHQFSREAAITFKLIA
jgi:hypothetical protein